MRERPGFRTGAIAGYLIVGLLGGIIGGLLVITPAISDYFYQAHLVALMKQPGITSVNLDGKMADLYRIGCWLTGSLMVAVAVKRSLASSEASEPRTASRPA